MKIDNVGRCVPALLLYATGVMAQEASDTVAGGSAVAVPAAARTGVAYVPLNLKQKYLYTFNEAMGPARWIGFTIHAAMDQAEKSPNAWGNGPDSFGVRVASHFGKSLLRENIAFGVRALDHEDPRYFRDGERSGWSRTKYALTRTVLARRDTGEWMPAYSQIFASYITPFLVESWRPEKFNVGRGLRGGSVGIGMGVATNLWQEFWPDLKKHAKILRRADAFSGNH